MTWLRNRKWWQRILLILLAFMVVFFLMSLVLSESNMHVAERIAEIGIATYLLLEAAHKLAGNKKDKRAVITK